MSEQVFISEIANKLAGTIGLLNDFLVECRRDELCDLADVMVVLESKALFSDDGLGSEGAAWVSIPAIVDIHDAIKLVKTVEKRFMLGGFRCRGELAIRITGEGVEEPLQILNAATLAIAQYYNMNSKLILRGVLTETEKPVWSLVPHLCEKIYSDDTILDIAETAAMLTRQLSLLLNSRDYIDGDIEVDIMKEVYYEDRYLCVGLEVYLDKFINI